MYVLILIKDESILRLSLIYEKLHTIKKKKSAEALKKGALSDLFALLIFSFEEKLQATA